MSRVDTTALVEREGRRLFGVAYRLLGSVAEAEDTVQETFLRWEQTDQAAVENPGGWLTTVLTRYCLDQLRSARARREAYIGTWLPEPLVESRDRVAEDPVERVTLDESVSLAMLVVLETLSPAERAVFVLHSRVRHDLRRSWLDGQPVAGSLPAAGGARAPSRRGAPAALRAGCYGAAVRGRRVPGGFGQRRSRFASLIAGSLRRPAR